MFSRAAQGLPALCSADADKAVGEGSASGALTAAQLQEAGEKFGRWGIELVCPPEGAKASRAQRCACATGEMTPG